MEDCTLHNLNVKWRIPDDKIVKFTAKDCYIFIIQHLDGKRNCLQKLDTSDMKIV